MKGESLVTLIFGAAIGAAAGILFAPEKGSVTRQKVKEKAEKGLEDIKEGTSKTYASALEGYEELRTKFNIRARKARIDLKGLKTSILEEGDNIKEQTRLKLLEKLNDIEKSLDKSEETEELS